MYVIDPTLPCSASCGYGGDDEGHGLRVEAQAPTRIFHGADDPTRARASMCKFPYDGGTEELTNLGATRWLEVGPWMDELVAWIQSRQMQRDMGVR